MISQAGWWTRTPSATLSSQKNEMLIFRLHSTSDDWLGWLMDSNLIHHPSPPKKMKCSFLDYVQLLMISRAALWTQTHLPPLSCQKMKWLFLDYVQLLMISWAARWTWTRSNPHLQPKNWNAHILIMFTDVGQTGQWTQTPSTTPLQPIKWNASFWTMFTSDDQPGWSMDSNPIHHPSPANEMKNSFLDYVQLLIISWAGQ